MAIDNLTIPYDDFQMGETIDPEQFDLNNLYIKNKVNELVFEANKLLNNGAGSVEIVPPAPFTATNVQAFIDELMLRLIGTTPPDTGASLIGASPKVNLAGLTVGEQLRALDDMLSTAFATTAKIADNAVTTPKIADLNVTTPKIANKNVTRDKIADYAVNTGQLEIGAVGDSNIKDGAVIRSKLPDRVITSNKIGLGEIKQENLDPSLMNTIPEQVLVAKVTELEDEMDVVQFRMTNVEDRMDDTETLVEVVESNLLITDGKINSHVANTQIHLSTTDRTNLNNAYSRIATSVTNWNSAVTGGIYSSLSSATNRPVDLASPFLGEVHVYNSSNIKQVAWQADQIFPRKFERYMVSGTWQAWRELSDSNYITPSDMPDPNTSMLPMFLTNHANMGSDSNTYWFVEQISYVDSGNRTQHASTYNGAPDFKVRHNFNGVWSPWSPSFRSVSDGKALVANAITGKGVPTAVDATFAQMATNVSNISAGGYASGNVNADSGTTLFTSLNGDLYSSHFVTVSGLTFEPSIIILTTTSGMTTYQSKYPFQGTTGVANVYNVYASPTSAVTYSFKGKTSPAYVNNTGFRLPVTSENNYNWYAYQ